MNTQQIAETTRRNFGGTIPAQLEAIIEAMVAAKTLGSATQDRLQATCQDLTDGAFGAIRDAIREQRQLDSTSPSSSADARTDRILRTRDSSGKASSRRW